MRRQRVVEYFDPEEAQSEILGKSDRTLVAIALRNLFSNSTPEMGEVVEQRFPMVVDGSIETPPELFFTRDDAPIIIGALALLDKTHIGTSPMKELQRRQLRSLMGEIVSEVPLRFVPSEIYPEITKAHS